MKQEVTTTTARTDVELTFNLNNFNMITIHYYDGDWCQIPTNAEINTVL